MMKESINELLNKLDKCLNSSSLLPCFEEEYTMNFSISDFLLGKLKSGEYHQALIKNDCERGFDNYVELLIEGNELHKIPFFGSTYNGEKNLVINAISEAAAQKYLIKLLTGIDKYFSTKNEGKLVSLEQAKRLTNAVFQDFDSSKENVFFYEILPNFLWKVNEIEEGNISNLGYFEGHHKDFVLLIKVINGKKININILLTNGYG